MSDTTPTPSSSSSHPSPGSPSQQPWQLAIVTTISSTAVSLTCAFYAGRALVAMLARETLPDWKIVVGLALAPVVIAVPTSVKPLVAAVRGRLGSGK